VVEGAVEGVIAAAPRGDGGFGYDPVFYVPELGRTMAELTPEVKNTLSHRARAAAKAAAILAEINRGG
jgi:XTP/dITP diphosphohydrolase